MAKRLGSHLVGAGTHTHLESHLSLVAAVRTGVLESALEEDELSVRALSPLVSCELVTIDKNK